MKQNAIHEPAEPVKAQAVLSGLPERLEIDIPKLNKSIQSSGVKIFVLDDDPTGTQTVHDVTVLTSWSYEEIKTALLSPQIATYVSTNSRSMTEIEAKHIQHEFLESLHIAYNEIGRDFRIVSRSDSTLRGHFPAETDALKTGLQNLFDFNIDGTIIAPFFYEGNRVTAKDVHFIKERDTLIPVAKTEYAQDHLFGYQHSHLGLWIEEKTYGRVQMNSVASFSLEEMRTGGVSLVRDKLMQICNGQYVIVNALDYDDLATFVAGLCEAEEKGKRFLYRTAASFVRVRGGMDPKGLVAKDQIFSIDHAKNPGLVVIGSYVERTTQQLESLVTSGWGAHIELLVDKLVEEHQKRLAIKSTASKAIDILKSGRDVVISTSREYLRGTGSSKQRKIEKSVSDSLVEISRRIVNHCKVRFFVAKGGITSHVLAREALGVKSAWVIGQIAPGVPVWRLGRDSALPNVPYVVFPGNVGDKDTLTSVAWKLSD